MMQRIWTCYLFEMYKTIQYQHAAMGPVLVLVTVLCAPMLYPIAQDGSADYGFIAYITPLALNFLGFLLLLIYSAGLVAGEIGSGTLRQVLIRPVRRQEILFAKFLNGVSYAVLLTVIVGASSWSMAALLGDLNGVSYGGELIYSKEEMSRAYLAGALLSLAPQIAGVAYALLISTLTRSALAAATSAVGLWIVLDLVKYPLGIEKFLFTTYLEQPWVVFSARSDAMDAAWFPMLWQSLVVSLVFTVAALSAAGLVLNRRNFSG